MGGKGSSGGNEWKLVYPGSGSGNKTNATPPSRRSQPTTGRQQAPQSKETPLASGPKRSLEGKYTNWGEVFKQGMKWGAPMAVVDPLLGIAAAAERGNKEKKKQHGEQTDMYSGVPNIKARDNKRYGDNMTGTGVDSLLGGDSDDSWW